MSWLREPDAEPIPGYRLIEPIGTGGFGEVWKCTAPGGILKAIKFVYGNLNADDGDSVRAEQERKALERVKGVRHPFVLSMDRIEVVGGELAIVMELADKNLYDVLEECRRAGYRGIPRGDAIRYLLDAAEGLDHLIDKHNLQHLDVKPRNLFLTADRVKVADFGLVKNIERPSAAGLTGGISPVYAAPETFTGKISKHSDQYSLAVVYCELVGGRRPFAGKNVRQLAMQHMADAPDLSMIPEADRAVVATALAKDPLKRFPTCQAFIRGLSPTIVQTCASIDLDDEAADIGVMPPPASAGDEDAEIGVSPAGGDDEGPRTIVLAHGIPRYRVTHNDGLPGEPDGWGDDEADDPDAPDSVVDESPRRPAELGDPEAEVDLGGPAEGPRPDVTATRIAKGVLRPTLFVGLGAFGRRALAEVRCRILDRFGDPGEIPAYRFLYIDSDLAAIDLATAGTPEVALSYGETFAIPLQPVINYRRRMIDHLNVWLPREKLHAIPRSLQPQGSRALGRLAYVDNFARLQSRLRRELQVATLPEVVDQSVEQTALGRGKKVPRVYVFGSACGGSSGMLADLGYSMRRLLRQLSFHDAAVTLFAFCGSPADPGSSRLELANVYATAVELNHYGQPDVTYDFHFGPDGPHVSDTGMPFDAVYLVAARERTPEAVRDAVAHLATYVGAEISSPLGPTMERARRTAFTAQKPGFRSFGTATVWFPRGLLLRVAARRAVARLIEVWSASVLPKAMDGLEKLCASVLSDPGLRWESLCAELNRLAVTTAGCPVEATEQFVDGLEREAGGPIAAENPSAWSADALERVRRWAGPGTGRELEAHWKKSQFFRNLTHASQQLGEQWDEYLSGQLRELIRRPGNRLATAEAGYRRIIEFCDRAIRVQWDGIERHYQGMKRVHDDLLVAQQGCHGGVKMLLAGSSRAVRAFLDQAKLFCRQRIAQDLLEAGVQFFMTLRGRMEERLRDLGFARQRLKHLRQVLAAACVSGGDPSPYESGGGFEISDPFWEAVRGTAAVEIVLPAGVPDLETSADQFVQSLRPEHWLALDDWLQSEVLAPHGDLHIAATAGADVAAVFGRPLVEQAAWHLGTILPITDVAQVEFSAAEARGAPLGSRLRERATTAAPMVSDRHRQTTYLLTPETEPGQALGQAAVASQPWIQVIPVTNTTDLTVLREQPPLAEDALAEVFAAAREVYHEVAAIPGLSPHARFDVGAWTPLGRRAAVS
jgi:hypothetical protein